MPAAACPRYTPRPHPGPTGAVARQQGVAVESRGTALAAGPCGVVQAAAAGPGQGVAVTDNHVGVTVATAITGLAHAAQHQRVPEEARCTSRDGGLVSVPRPPRSSLGLHVAHPQLTARRRLQHNQVCRGTGCGHLAGHSPPRSCKDISRSPCACPSILGAALPQGPTLCPGPPGGSMSLTRETRGSGGAAGARLGVSAGSAGHLLVGRYCQGAGAADTGGCGVP